MADGDKFDPDKMTAASWFYPLGTRVRVSVRSRPQRSVLVTITDRGPAKRLVRQGRVIDLARAAFAQIARLQVGLVHVSIQPIEDQGRGRENPDAPRFSRKPTREAGSHS